MKVPSILEMLEAGVHFGHQSSRWHPKMEEFIFTERNGVHVIDLEKTRVKLEETLNEVRALAAEGKEILFITTKAQAREIVKEAAIDCGSPYLVERWIGGLLTNFNEMKKLFKKYVDLKEEQANGDLERYTKQERSKIIKDLEKMEKTLVGISHLQQVPDVLFVPALQREKTAVTEANKTNVPIIGICDTNANPDKAKYVIPANDDAVNSIKLMVGLVAEAIKEGKEEYKKKAPVVKKDLVLKRPTRPEEKQKRGLDWN